MPVKNAMRMRSPTAGGYAIALTEILNTYCISISFRTLTTALAIETWLIC
ncbi:MAG: hypothetical protein RMX96_09335 [Nostoc sp. ChiSLP02]|nr:hypothetical protein [Nostoc sp. DedSLP05]MDZ8101682.1 hypothetical protein [Nostoc sp. DedSLP01]MDZ8185044.1 hypothetical protein [Nostoc sp. ChiSLP02]